MPKSDMAKAVSDATGRKVTDEAIFASVLNAAQQKGDLTELPEYQAGADFTPYGQSFQKNPRIFSTYLDTLAVKYGLVFIKAGLAQNPLGIFKRGEIPFGGKIESVVFDVIEPKMYRPDLIDDTKALVQAYKDQSEELAKQKEANTKLMYERLRRAENVEKEEDKEAEALDDALDDIDIYDIDED